MSSRKGTQQETSCDRRSFLALAAGLTATGGLTGPLSTQDPPTGRGRGQGRGRGRGGRGRGQQPPLPPPPNEIPPSIQFQPAPGGTAA